MWRDRTASEDGCQGEWGGWGWSAGECQGGACSKQSISIGSHKGPVMLAGGGDEKWCLPTLLFLEKFPKDSEPAAHILRSVSKSSHIPQVLFKTSASLLCNSDLYLWFFKGENLVSYHPGIKLHWFPKPDVIWTHLPQCGSPVPLVPGVESDPFISPCLWLVLPGYWFLTTSLPLLPSSLWPFLSNSLWKVCSVSVHIIFRVSCIDIAVILMCP